MIGEPDLALIRVSTPPRADHGRSLGLPYLTVDASLSPRGRVSFAGQRSAITARLLKLDGLRERVVYRARRSLSGQGQPA